MRRAIRRRLRRARIASGRILRSANDTTELDLIVAAGGALYIVETKYRNCLRIEGGKDDPEWTAVYGRRRRYAFLNPLLQADRQRRFVNDALTTAGLKCKVYRSVVLTGAGHTPQVHSLFRRPTDIAEWIARHAGADSPTADAAAAFDAFLEMSGAGLLARMRHIATVARWSDAIRAAGATIALGASATLITAGTALWLVDPVAVLARTPPAAHASHTPEPDSDANDAPAKHATLVPTDRCTSLANTYLVDTDGRLLHFVATGATGRLVPRKSGITAGLVFEGFRATMSSQRIETLLLASPATLRAHDIAFDHHALWLPCSRNGDRPLNLAIEGRLAMDGDRPARYRTGLNAIGVRHREIMPDLGKAGLRIDWVEHRRNGEARD